MLKIIDELLNRFTMYRVVLYGLSSIVLYGFILSVTGKLYFTPIQMIVSLGVLIATSWVTNKIFSKIWNVYTNTESWLITSLILFLIITPIQSINEMLFLILAASIAMVSKYIIAIGHKHIFNPAALSVFLLGIIGFDGAAWWVGSESLLPVVLIIGLLIVRKIRRFEMVIATVVSGLITICLFGLKTGVPITESIIFGLTSFPIIFFATIMVTEPLTTPPTRKYRRIYGVIAGILFGSQFELGPIFSTPELALLIANIFSFIVSPKERLKLILKEKIQITPNIYEFIFKNDRKFSFLPGQYLEWTLQHNKTDSRGDRRYFTVASSPEEKEIKLGIRTQEDGSSFKKAMLSLREGDKVYASQLAGDFTLPENKKEKLVFIAGGIGITPFRSMILHLLEIKEKRDIVFFYAVSDPKEIAYKNILNTAEEKLGIKVIYMVTNKSKIEKDWKGKVGYLTEEMIKNEVPEFRQRTYYLSGPNSMVDSYKKIIKSIGVSGKNIVTDYFPGF